MFVVMADIRVKDECDDDFQKWFKSSNEVVSKMPGFKSRHLFCSHQNNHMYRIVFMHESKDTFIAMHNSPEHDAIFAQGRPLMDADPTRLTFKMLE